MKIIQVSHSFYPRFEGIGNYCYQLSKYLARQGHEVNVITSRLSKYHPIQEVRDGFTINRCITFGSIKNNRLTCILNKLLKTEADIIHTHSYIFVTSNQVAINKKITHRPFLLHLHGGFDIIPPNGDIITRFEYGIAKKIYDHTIGKWTFKTADLIASVSRKDIEISKNIFKVDENIFRWIPNAVDINCYKSYKNSKLNDIYYVLFIGSLIPRKGIIDLLKISKIILKERSNIVFIIIGDGPLKGYLEKNLNPYNNKIKVLGRIKKSQLLEWLSKASVLLLPSYSEGLPTVCLEAFSFEAPVVASNVGGIPEVVLEGKTGFTFPPGDVKLCVKKILRILDDEQLRRRMGQNGRKLVMKYYTWEKVINKVEKTYKEIINT